MRAIAILTCLLVGSLADAAPKPEAELRKLVDRQIKWAREGGVPDEIDAWFTTGGPGIIRLTSGAKETDEALDAERLAYLINGEGIKRHKVGSFATHISPNGDAAVFSFTLHVAWRVSANDPDLSEDHDYRVSQLAVKTAKGWRVTGGFWSEPRANAEVNQQAKAGTLDGAARLAAGGEKSLLDAFQELTNGAFDTAAATRKDLVAFGSGPGERTVGGASLAKAWTAAWSGKITIDSALAATSGKDTLGLALANITLAKKDYKIPFRVLFVFERASSTAPWSVVHAHFAVP